MDGMLLVEFMQGRCISGPIFETSERMFVKEDQNYFQTDFFAFANAKKSICHFDLGLRVAVEIGFFP